MPFRASLEYSSISLILLCLTALGVMWRKGLVPQFPLPTALLAMQALDTTVRFSILFFRKDIGLSLHTAYEVLFWGGWSSSILIGVLRITIIYSVFHQAMRPMEGLNRIGRIVFRWVAAVSLVTAFGFVAGSRLSLVAHPGTEAFTRFASQAQQGISVLTLCLLLFVCFATKPLGLTYHSQLFGIILGLGILATTDLVQAAWFSTNGAHSVYSGIYVFSTLGIFAAFSTWAVYFAMPEPERRMILLPTTSPFFFWNKLSEALGDHPGHVAVAGFHPGMLAAAEMAMLSAPDRASDRARQKIGLGAEYSLPELQAARS